jgi:hypothetical protein
LILADETVKKVFLFSGSKVYSFDLKWNYFLAFLCPIVAKIANRMKPIISNV